MKAEAIVLVYDWTKRETFNEITNWLNQIEQNCAEGVLKVLVANKIDRLDVDVEHEEGEEFAKNNKLRFFKVSAKTGDNVEKLFTYVTNALHKRKQKSRQNGLKRQETSDTMGPSDSMLGLTPPPGYKRRKNLCQKLKFWKKMSK